MVFEEGDAAVGETALDGVDAEVGFACAMSWLARDGDGSGFFFGVCFVGCFVRLCLIGNCLLGICLVGICFFVTCFDETCFWRCHPCNEGGLANLEIRCRTIGSVFKDHIEEASTWRV